MRLYLDMHKALPEKLSDDTAKKIKSKKEKTLSELTRIQKPTSLEDPKYAPGKGASNKRTATQAAGHIDDSERVSKVEVVGEDGKPRKKTSVFPRGTKPSFITNFGASRVLRDWIHTGKRPQLPDMESKKSIKVLSDFINKAKIDKLNDSNKPFVLSAIDKYNRRSEKHGIEARRNSGQSKLIPGKKMNAQKNKRWGTNYKTVMGSDQRARDNTTPKELPVNPFKGYEADRPLAGPKKPLF